MYLADDCMVRRLDLTQARATPKVFSWRWWALGLLACLWSGTEFVGTTICAICFGFGFADFRSEMFGIIWSLASHNGYWLLAPNHIAVARYESHELQPNSKTH